MSSRATKNRKASKGSKLQQTAVIYRPPSFKPNIVVRHKYRFTNTTSGATNVTNRNILGAMGGMCTVTNTTLITFFNCFRLNYVEIWGPTPSVGATSSVSVNWIGSINAPALQIADSTNSTSVPAHVRAIPPPQSSASFWQEPVTQSVSFFNLNCAVGSIVEIGVEGILGDETATLGVTIGTGVLGTIYYLALDGNTNTYKPLNMSTTV